MLKKFLISSALCLFSQFVDAEPSVLISTNYGDIKIELDKKAAPKTVENFVAYVNDKFYDGTIFHRTIKNFMIQGGGFDANMQEKSTKKPVENEAEIALKNGLRNQRGSIAMARTMDPNSATSQFFINHQDNNNLDFPSFDGYGYAVFGNVVSGMDVVDKIAEVPTTSKNGHQDVPKDNVLIKSIRIVN